MKSIYFSFLCSLMFLVIVLPSKTLAEEGVVMVQEEEVGGVALVSGGVGLSEREYMEDLADQFNVKLVFALEAGNYLSSIPVTINGNGVDIRTETAGPWLYADLPPGSYELTASYDGVEERKTMRISEGQPLQTMLFTWQNEQGTER
jgi:hypothetical protein